MLDDQAEVRIDSLLEDIADAKKRLQRAIELGRTQHERLQESRRKLQHTMHVIYQRNDLEYPDLPARRRPPQSTLTDKLTPRETEVLRLVAEGLSTKQIAAKLNIAFKTAVCHRTHILEKLRCHESASLVRLAIQAGLVA